MPFYEFAEKNPKYSVTITCSAQSCGKPITQKQQMFECSNCSKSFHPSCKSIFGQHIARRAAEKEWFCSNSCENTRQSIAGNNTTNIEASIEQIICKLNMYGAEFTEIKAMIETVQASQAFISQEFDTLRVEVQKISQSNIELTDKVAKSEYIQKKQSEQISELEARLDRFNQEKVSNELIIAGIPSDEVQPDVIVQSVLDVLGCTESFTDVSLIEYMPNYNRVKHPSSSNTTGMRNILVKFKNIEAKYKIVDKKKGKLIHLRQIGFASPQLQDKQIYLRDHLTHYQLGLYRDARKLKKLIRYKFLWISKSNIFFRQEEKAKVVRISSRNDLTKLMEANNITLDQLTHI